MGRKIWSTILLRFGAVPPLNYSAHVKMIIGMCFPQHPPSPKLVYKELLASPSVDLKHDLQTSPLGPE